MTGEVSRLRLRHLASSAERIKTTRRISDQPVMPCRAVTTLGAAWRLAGREVQTARTCPARSPGPDPSMKTRRTCPCAPAPSQRGFQKAVVSRSARRQDWRRHRDGFEGLAIDLRGISLDMPFLDFALHFSIRSLVTHGRRARGAAVAALLGKKCVENWAVSCPIAAHTETPEHVRYSLFPDRKRWPVNPDRPGPAASLPALICSAVLARYRTGQNNNRDRHAPFACFRTRDLRASSGLRGLVPPRARLRERT